MRAPRARHVHTEDAGCAGHALLVMIFFDSCLQCRQCGNLLCSCLQARYSVQTSGRSNAWHAAYPCLLVQTPNSSPHGEAPPGVLHLLGS